MCTWTIALILIPGDDEELNLNPPSRDDEPLKDEIKIAPNSDEL